MGDSIRVIDALQIAGLLPCLFVIGLLAFLTRDPHRILIPVAYFICLACSFMPPLRDWLGIQQPGIHIALLALQALQPGLCFLLIIQFLSGEIPRRNYWLILLVPLSAFLAGMYHADLIEPDCVLRGDCLSATALQTIYGMVATGIIFLFLISYFSHIHLASGGDVLRRHKYWLVIALISLYLVLMGLDLAWISGIVERSGRDLSATVVRISFVYLMLTSLFRIFDQSSPFGMGQPQFTPPKPIDPAIITQIEAAMRDEQLYREMGFSRESLARHLGLAEHTLSRVINQHYGRNFNEFVNSYRVAEAKRRLREEHTPVTAIAFEVGFSSIASFNRVFKLLAGCSPTEYRTYSEAESNRASG